MEGKKNVCDHFTVLNTCAAGVGLGVTWGLGTLILSYISMWFDLGNDLVISLSSLYVGDDAPYLGGIIGYVWGAVDGFIFGFVGAFIYNKVLKCHCCRMCNPKKC